MDMLYRTHFPYCIDKTESGYVLLNRKYKPVGFLTNTEVDYSSYPIEFSPASLKEATLKKLSINGETDFPVFLYGNGTLPWSSSENEKAYLEKLSLLAKMKIR